MAMCKNCGSGSHCGVPLYSDQHFSLKNELPSRAKLCDTCRCEQCSQPKQCFICKEYSYACSSVDYRDHKDELKGRINVCQKCLESDK